MICCVNTRGILGMNSTYVLDAYAVLAFIQKESGWERVKELLRESASGTTEIHISAINMAEVQYRILRQRRKADEVMAALALLPLQIASADEYIPRVVELKARYPLSLADCFAAALALDIDCLLVTGDPEFHKLEGMLRIEWLGA